ncbi:MAG TPA: hypothetical protein PKZ70_00905, partial [Candidatus Atribacteria bacterium]|nr:hypothetical protein [Candidatus Atribacteria bacterium]
HPQVRRQLLEYYLVYHPKAVILVDGDNNELYQVTFPLTNNFSRRWVGIVSILVFTLGLVIGQWIK